MHLPIALQVSLLVSGCSSVPPTPPQQAAQQVSSAVETVVLETSRGLASYYAKMLHGRLTASGVKLNLDDLVAAHPTYPFGTLVRVTNLANQHVVNVSIVDRGPARGPRAEGVIIDLSRAAAEELSLFEDGRGNVILEVLKWGGDETTAIGTN
jgi:peptidoglycan lytic transglycosylase